MSRRLLLLLLLVLVALSSWLLLHEDERTVAPVGERADQPDYFLHGIDSLSTDEQGNIHYRLIASSLTRYPERDAIELEKPWIEIHQEDGSRWTIQAQHGSVVDQQREFLLHGEVEIRHLDTPHVLHLETESLRLLPDTQYAETADPVRLHTPGSQLTGTGMELYGKQQRLLLLSSVRGIHHANQP